MTTYSSNTYLVEYGMEMSANANYIYNFFRGKGWSKNSICAMLGNMQRESTINPGLWQSLNSGNTSGGFGLVQWTPATNLINWCNSKGYDYTDITAQCNKIMDELENGGQWISTSSYPESFSEFTTSTKDIEYLTYCFLKNYERAGVEAASERVTHANYWSTHIIPGVIEDDEEYEDDYQYFVLPLTHVNISQDEYGTYSHQGMLAIDFLGWNDSGRVMKCPYYAPCDCTCVAKGTNGDWVAWQSDDKVHCADGSLQIMNWVQAHDDTPFEVGTKKKQGEVIGHTGTTGNVTGDHLHLNVAKGKWSDGGWATNSYGVGYIKNEQHIYEVMYLMRNAKIIAGNTHTWQTEPEERPKKKKKKKKYKFVLFNSRRRILNG